ncbi:hypothetical protein [Micromonospora sp. MH33]|uniref:hypothetical protein n=1 Tax=Micromonospora sp. MH33 TaxID=1945509 RepID=UPI001AEFFBFA|nr:hypothetical protein [Micromonospora sp. MH33]
MTPDDRVTSTVITGRSAARTKEMICASAAWSVSHPTMMMPSRRRHLAVTDAVETRLVTRS